MAIVALSYFQPKQRRMRAISRKNVASNPIAMKGVAQELFTPQAESGVGLAWFAATAAVFSVASLVPLLKGETPEKRAGPVFNADAELWNGRLAMLGIFALAATEYLTGAPFVDV